MATFQRMTMVNAIQFDEEKYHENILEFPMVFDKALNNKEWINKRASEGRYYIALSPSADTGEIEFVTVNNGDYIVCEEYGLHYVIPQIVFNRHYEKLAD